MKFLSVEKKKKQPNNKTKQTGKKRKKENGRGVELSVNMKTSTISSFLCKFSDLFRSPNSVPDLLCYSSSCFSTRKVPTTELVHSFSFCSCVCFCLYGPLNCISFHKLSRQLSAFSLCSSGLFFCLIGPFNCISL